MTIMLFYSFFVIHIIFFIPIIPAIYVQAYLTNHISENVAHIQKILSIDDALTELKRNSTYLFHGY